MRRVGSTLAGSPAAGRPSPPRAAAGCSHLSTLTHRGAALRLEKSYFISFFLLFLNSPPEESLPAGGTLAGLAVPAASPCIFLAEAPTASLKTSFQTPQTFPKTIAVEELNVGANGGLYL